MGGVPDFGLPAGRALKLFGWLANYIKTLKYGKDINKTHQLIEGEISPGEWTVKGIKEKGGRLAKGGTVDPPTDPPVDLPKVWTTSQPYEDWLALQLQGKTHEMNKLKEQGVNLDSLLLTGHLKPYLKPEAVKNMWEKYGKLFSQLSVEDRAKLLNESQDVIPDAMDWEQAQSIFNKANISEFVQGNKGAQNIVDLINKYNLGKTVQQGVQTGVDENVPRVIKPFINVKKEMVESGINLEKGGKAVGPSHEQGGIPGFTKSGNMVEFEGNEMIFSKKDSNVIEKLKRGGDTNALGKYVSKAMDNWPGGY
jgi:hypothetical protein